MSDRARDPYTGFRFVVEIGAAPAAGFSHVAGLERTTTVDDFREGGVNDHVHKLAGVTKHQDLVLKRGLADRTELWDWHQQVIAGQVRRRSITVVLQDVEGAAARRWVFEDAFPSKWSGTELDAAANTIAVESVSFSHHGMRKA